MDSFKSDITMISISLSFLKTMFDIKKTSVKVSLLLSCLIYLLLIFYIAQKRFTTRDVIPELKPINTEVLKTFGPFTVKVNTGMFIKNFPIFDVSKNQFLVEAVLWFEFNPEEIMLETIEKFSFDKGTIKFKSPPDIKIINKRLFVKYDLLFELNTDLSFQPFPFDSHKIPIVLSNNFITPEEMYFVVERTSFRIQSGTIPVGWKLKDTSIDAGFLNLKLDEQDATKNVQNPKALFTIHISNTGLRRILIIFLPIFALIFLALFSFIMNLFNLVGRATLAITGVTGLLGFRFVIEQLMPKVGYFTTTDSIYLFLLIQACAIFIAQILLTRKVEAMQKIDPKPPLDSIETANNFIFLIMTLLLIGATTYILLW